MTVESRRISFVLVTTCALALLPRAAAAVDGVIEINQARALAGDAAAGDDPGFPVTITHAGSYRLTSDLTVSTAVDGIYVDVSDGVVTLDLNRFSISHVGASCCAAVHVPTAAPGSSFERLKVRNGALRHFDSGIRAETTPCTVDAVEALGTAVLGAPGVHFGIAVGKDSMVTASVATGNFVGISAESSSRIVGNIVESNPGNGIQVDSGTTVLDNTVRFNGGTGIFFLNFFNGYGGNIVTHNGNQDVILFGDASQLGVNVCGGDTVCP